MAGSADITDKHEDQFRLTLLVRDGVATASSVDVSAVFGKHHKDVLRAVDALLEQAPELRARSFALTSTAVALPNGGTRQDRAFDMDRDGFALLAMGFTGAKALRWKLRWIEAFNRMEAELRAISAPSPEPASPSPAAVPFLAGAERLVSSLDVARALDRRHTGVLREVDVLVADRPDLLGRHVRFATYLHENRRPYRCFHLDRVGFEAVMRRLPTTDPSVVALRDATLAAFGPSAIEARAEPAPAPAAAPRLDRDGIALMRIAGETVTVDMLRFEPGAGERAVLITHDGDLLLDKAECHYPSRNWQGRRVGHVLTPLPGGARPRYQAGWVIGTVIEERSAQASGQGGRVASRLPLRPKPSRALPLAAVAALPTLGDAAVQGHA